MHCLFFTWQSYSFSHLSLDISMPKRPPLDLTLPYTCLAAPLMIFHGTKQVPLTVIFYLTEL